MKLYNYFRSSASYRVRIALNLKGLSYDYASVDLPAGANTLAEYRTVNPQGLVPSLVDSNQLIHQSLAICEYLEKTHRKPPI
jgi:maleylpyruvate isomerase